MALRLYNVYTSRRIALTRKVAKSGENYLITLPKELGKQLHGKTVLVEITTLEDYDNS